MALNQRPPGIESGAFWISREHSMHHGYRGYARVGTHSHKNSRTNAGLLKSVCTSHGQFLQSTRGDSLEANCLPKVFLQDNSIFKWPADSSRIPPEKQPMKPFTEIRGPPCASAMASPRDVSPPRRRNRLHDRDYAPVETDVAGDKNQVWGASQRSEVGCGSKWKTDVGPQMWMSSLVFTIQLMGYLILTHTQLLMVFFDGLYPTQLGYTPLNWAIKRSSSYQNLRLSAISPRIDAKISYAPSTSHHHFWCGENHSQCW